MNIQITSRHSKVSGDTQKFLENELKKLMKFNDKITYCRAVIDNEHTDKTTEIIMEVKGNTISAKAKADNLGKSVDNALIKAKRQLKKINEKKKNHKHLKNHMTLN